MVVDFLRTAGKHVVNIAMVSLNLEVMAESLAGLPDWAINRELDGLKL